MRRRSPAVALLVAALVLTGCGEQPADTPSLDLPAGVSAELVQLRSDVAARQAQVQVHNDTDAAVRIGTVTVTDPRFAAPAGRVLAGRTSTVPAGGTTDIRIQLPEMACDTDSGTALDAGATVALEIDGVVAAGPLADELGVLPPLHRRECLAQRVSDAADLTLQSFTPSPPGEPAILTLAIAPTGHAAAVIDGIQTTNLLTFGTGPGNTVDVSPIGVAVDESSAPVDIDLPLLPWRCDPHAVQEDKRGTIFTVDVEVDGEPGQIELAASEDMRGRILTWVGQWCGFGT